MDSVRGVRIHCACGAIMKCKKLSASKLCFFSLLCCLCGVFTAPFVLQWILTCRYLAGHGALKNTMDSELRCRIACVYEAIMSRHNLAGHDPLKNTMVFERRSRIASVYQVILTPCMSGRLIEVGKKWLLAFFWSILVLQLRESGSIEKHNGLWPPSQNQLCFTGRRDCVTATCKTQWILTRRPGSIVFFNRS